MPGENFSISVIIPVFDEEENIAALYQELKAVLDSLNTGYEIIFVDDKSRDKSLNALKEIGSKDSLCRIISFSRTFGQTAALACGIENAMGGIIVLMDADLQNDPRDIPALINKIREGYDVASGWRQNRKDPFLNRRLPSFLANKLVSFLSGVRLHDYGCTLKAYKADVLKEIRLYGEMHRFIPIYASWIGAKIAEMPVNHRPRLHGKSKYNMWRTLKVIFDLLTIKFISGYQTKPIYVFGASGVISIILSFACVATLIYNKVAHKISMIQSPLLLLSALFVILGVQFILMGLLAEMQSRTYFESLRKPIYHIKEKTNF